MNFSFPLSEDIAEDPWGPPRFLILSSSPRPFRDDAASRFVFSPENDYDGIVVLDDQGTETVQTIIRQSKIYLMPVANLSGVPLPFADFQAGDQTAETMGDAIEHLSHVARLIRTLPSDVRASDVPETILLARAYSRKRVIEPVYDPSVRDCVIYPVAGLVDNPGRLAERMTNAGYFTRMFFDRLHACPECGSSRLNAREECMACRSADLTDESLIHHLRCGYRGLEAEFRQGDLLICPKCRHPLHFQDVDHEKRGRVTTCGCCGHVNSQAAVGFVCIDCQARHDSEAIATRDFYKYELTRKGERVLLTNQPWVRRECAKPGPSPHEAVIRHVLRLHSRYGRPLTILNITLGEEKTARNSDGMFSLSAVSIRIAEILRSETRETDVVIKAENGFMVYMPETFSDGVDALSARLRDKIGSSVPKHLDLKITALRPDDLKPVMIRSF